MEQFRAESLKELPAVEINCILIMPPKYSQKALVRKQVMNLDYIRTSEIMAAEFYTDLTSYQEETKPTILNPHFCVKPCIGDTRMAKQDNATKRRMNTRLGKEL